MFKNICYVDTETTGLNPKECQVIELFVAEFDRDGVRTDHLYRFSFDESNANEKALEINKYHERKELWIGAKEFKDHFSEMIDLFLNKTIIAHNVSFDASFLRQEFVRCGVHRKPWKKELDTVSISRFIMENTRLYSHSLKALRFYFNVPRSDHHTAKDDVEDLILIVQHMQNFRDSWFKRTMYKLSFWWRSLK
jgi:DNA polymerase III alpha subunit (gram-positive type)